MGKRTHPPPLLGPDLCRPPAAGSSRCDCSAGAGGKGTGPWSASAARRRLRSGAAAAGARPARGGDAAAHHADAAAARSHPAPAAGHALPPTAAACAHVQLPWRPVPAWAAPQFRAPPPGGCRAAHTHTAPRRPSPAPSGAGSPSAEAAPPSCCPWGRRGSCSGHHQHWQQPQAGRPVSRAAWVAQPRGAGA